MNYLLRKSTTKLVLNFTLDYNADNDFSYSVLNFLFYDFVKIQYFVYICYVNHVLVYIIIDFKTKKSKIMHPILRNVLAVVVGLIVGFIINGGIINLNMSMLPLPEGLDITSGDGMKFLPIKYFVGPFLAHALGTLVGAYTTARLAASYHQKLVLLVGLLFLAGGIAAATMIPAPTWFVVLDLVGAYLPMAWLGAKLANRN